MLPGEINENEVVLDAPAQESTAQIPKKHYLVVGLLITGFALLIIGGFFWYTTRDEGSINIQYGPVKDSDGDLLSDEEERKLGTDPDKFDSDSDGLSDWIEIEQGFDPKNPRSINPDVFDGIEYEQRIQKQIQELLDRT